uniref:Cysteine-rich receptor-like protein kinase 25 n=1 Tax=Cajanus cajan TaxID=3821 RepID=A0A151U728_CAJCA|nr:Cysteine-rich receptor-like protein kinase 25 [Cajanus cajan]
MASFKLVYYLFTLISFINFVTNKAQDDLGFMDYFCSENLTTPNSPFQSNVRSLLSDLSSHATANNNPYYNTTVATTNHSHTAYGMFFCSGDVPPRHCTQCVANATQQILSLSYSHPNCSLSTDAYLKYDDCMIRFSNRSFFSTVDITQLGGSSCSGFNEENLTSLVSKTMKEAADKAAISPIGVKKYATKQARVYGFKTLYCEAQCTPDLSPQDCKKCLNVAQENCQGYFLPRTGLLSCKMGCDWYPFYRPSTAAAPTQPVPLTNPSNTDSQHSTYLSKNCSTIIITDPTFQSSLIALLSYFSSNSTTTKNVGEESTIVEGLQYDLTTIKAATNNFSHENKIGKGGFGEVYKGILDDGQHIAVKRLSTHSKQGSIEFVNEVLLIAKLQHKNLVALIGFCLEEQEKILIYEFMPNGSLDYLLYGIQQQKLSWSERYKIIEGTALGILYLHEYSRLKVIHRDLKPSNILLDKNMNPKISDFGMARIVEIDQDRGNTNRIVGTYGYMSPEYAMLGEFSEKSDVFSFGVMILEIITGKKNVQFYDSHTLMEGLIAYVWRQWKNKDLLSILDSHIKEIYSQEEVFQCIHIGLLCVQENPNIRPTMATIISYLNNYSLELPFPQKPSFFLSNHRMDQDTTRQQESSSNQTTNDFKLFSINEMSMSNIYPR